MSLWDAVYEWLSLAVEGAPVIRRDQDGNIPDRTFVTAKVIADLREGHAYVGSSDGDGIVRIQQGSLLTVAIQAFGPEAFEFGQMIRNSIERITAQDAMRSRGACFVRVLAGPTDITTRVGTTFEQRCMLDVQLRTNVVILDDVGFIERVELTGIIPPIEEKKIIGVITP